MRIANRLLAIAVALAMAAGGLLVAAEILLARLDRGPWILRYDGWYEAARGNRWDSGGPRAVFIGLAVAGVAVIMLQFVKASPRSLRLSGDQSRAGVSRRSLEDALTRTAARIDGVRGARVRVDGQRTRVVVGTARRTARVRPQVEEALTGRLEGLGLADTPRVSVEVKGGRR